MKAWCYFCEVEIEFLNVMRLNCGRQRVLQFHLSGGTEEINEDHSLGAGTKFRV
jgi:hypothetical protein